MRRGRVMTVAAPPSPRREYSGATPERAAPQGRKAALPRRGGYIRGGPGRASHQGRIVCMNKNSEIIRGVYAAFADGDVPRVLGALDGDVRWTEAEGFPYGGTYVGPDAVLANVFAKLGSEWEGFKA